jgi:hypothetical protein
MAKSVLKGLVTKNMASYFTIIELQNSLCFQILIQKFTNFTHNLHVNEERVTNVNAMAGRLLSGKHPESKSIERRSEEIIQLWKEVKELTEARQQVGDHLFIFTDLDSIFVDICFVLPVLLLTHDTSLCRRWRRLNRSMRLIVMLMIQ